MLLDLSSNLVYLANTKVASTATESTLAAFPQVRKFGGSPQAKHLNLCQFIEIRHELGATHCLTCCIIRHPVEKFISWFNYRSRPAIVGKERYLGDQTLDQHIANATAGDWGAADDRRFIYAGGYTADIVFKYEKLFEFNCFLRALYDSQLILPRKNVSPIASIPSAAQRQLISDRLADAVHWYDLFKADDCQTALKKLALSVLV